MGYNTDFVGQFDFNRPLTEDERLWLINFSNTRHEGKDDVGIDYWCEWVPSDEGRSLVWNESEKFYSYVDWLEYLIKEFFIPKNIILNGQVEWFGEEQGDTGVIVVKDNKVRVREGKIVYDLD